MLVVERPGFGPREIWETRDAGTLPLLHVAPMIITPHTTEGHPLTDVAIDSCHLHTSLHFPLFRVAICVLLYNGDSDPPLHPAHAHKATITIGQTSVIGLIVTEVVLGVTLLAFPPDYNALKAQPHLTRYLTNSEANPRLVGTRKAGPYATRKYVARLQCNISAIGRQVNCSLIEFVSITSPLGQTCGQYMNSYISHAGGYLTNPNSCKFCSVRTTDELILANSDTFSRSY